jgi:TldD protein
MEQLIKEALSTADTEYVDIRVQEIVITEVVYLGRELDRIGTRKLSGGSVRAFHRGAFGFATFTRPEELKKAVEEACRLSKSFPKTTEEKLAHVKPIVARIKPELKRDPRGISLEEKEALARKYNDIILRGGDKIQSSRVYYEDRVFHQIFASTEGSYIDEERVYTGVSFMAIAKDGINVQRAYESYGDQRGYDTVLGHEADVEAVVSDALNLLRAEKVEGGVYTVILDPQLAGVFIHEAFGHLSEADHMMRNERLKEIMNIGARFGMDELSVVDDATCNGERGYFAYDDEGTPAQKTYLIKDGILVGRLHSRQTAAIFGESPTGNARAIDFRHEPIVRMSVTYIEPRDADFEELIGDIKRGLYVIGSIGGQTELEMFTFSAQKAYTIENGKIGKLVRDVILSGNVFETLKNIEKIGNDLKLYGGLGGCGKRGQFPLPVSDGSPHIRIKNVVIGGK